MCERWLNKLSVRGCPLEAPAGGLMPFSPHDSVSPYDVAAALAYGRLDPAVYDFARAKYLQDAQALQSLLHRLDHYLTDALKRLRLRYRPEQRAKLSELMVREALFGIHCSACKGLGYQHKRNSIIRCARCDGSGRGALSQRERSRQVGIPYTSWKRNWEPQLGRLYSYFDHFQDSLNRHLQRQFMQCA